MNKVELIGNLGKDAEVRFSTLGKPWTTFNLATTDEYKGEKKTQWHTITCFNKTAEKAGELKKGNRVRVEGKIEYTTDEKDGKTRYFTKIIAFKAEPVGETPQATHQTAKSNAYQNQEDVPF